MAESYRPGQTAPASAQYKITGPRGGAVPGNPERTVVRGEKLPPTPQRGQRYEIADRTNNGAGRKK